MADKHHTELNPDTVKDDRTRMKEHFEVPHDQHTSRWSSLWDAKIFLPWDKGFAAPSLVDLLNSPEHSYLFSTPTTSSSPSNNRKRALVPGCGRGYDVLFFAQHGYDAVGVEVAEKAVESAKEYIAEEQAAADKFKAQEENLETKNQQQSNQGQVDFVVGDFFKDSWLNNVHMGQGEWDIIYDYTFLCALPPTFRPRWAARMKSLLKPGGLLICLEFPLYKDPATGGPPFGLTSEIYCELLGKAGSGDDFDGSDVVLERIVHEKPKRFHAISKETDMITVWKKSK